MDEFVNVKKRIEKDEQTLRKVKVNFTLLNDSIESPSRARLELADLDFAPVITSIHDQNLKIEGSSILYANDENIKISREKQEIICIDVQCSDEASENSFEIIQKLIQEDEIEEEIQQISF